MAACIVIQCGVVVKRGLMPRIVRLLPQNRQGTQMTLCVPWHAVQDWSGEQGFDAYRRVADGELRV